MYRNLPHVRIKVPRNAKRLAIKFRLKKKKNGIADPVAALNSRDSYRLEQRSNISGATKTKKADPSVLGTCGMFSGMSSFMSAIISCLQLHSEIVTMCQICAILVLSGIDMENHDLNPDLNRDLNRD